MRGARWLAAVVLATGCGPASRVPAGGPVDLARLLPEPTTLAGWTTVEGPVEYSPPTLFEYLDGGAERYRAHGFLRLLHVRYQKGEDAGDAVTLDLFDMGSELGAFGIYSGVRPKEAAFHAWGAEGHRSGTVAAAWKGRVFVHAEADADRPALVDALERLVAGACVRAPGSASPPSVLASLPPGGLVPRSERYVASDLLGHECLPGGVLARYAIDGRRGELFWCRLGRRRDASGALATLRSHHARAGRIEDGPASLGGEGFTFSDPSLGAGTVVAAGRFVAGVHGDLPPAARERLLRALLERLGK